MLFEQRQPRVLERVNFTPALLIAAFFIKTTKNWVPAEKQ